jgi:hypothetical protein
VVVAVRELTGSVACQESAEKGGVFVHLVTCVTTFAQVVQRSAGLANYELAGDSNERDSTVVVVECVEHEEIG